MTTWKIIGAGLTTHHADSQLHVTLPADGSFFIHVGDTQKKGGPEYAYRLRVSARRPDFELRVVPVDHQCPPRFDDPDHGPRRCAATDSIRTSSCLSRTPPSGFAISGGWVPADQTKVQITLTVPAEAREEPYVAAIGGTRRHART